MTTMRDARSHIQGRRAPGPSSVGFTLIELLVVIAIIALLITILVPSLRQAREIARKVACLAQTRTVGMAILLYAQERDGMLVPLRSAGNRYYADQPVGNPGARDDHWNLKIESYLPGRGAGACPSDTRLLPEGWSRWSVVYNEQLGAHGWPGLYERDHTDYRFNPYPCKIRQVVSPFGCVMLYDGLYGQWADTGGSFGWPDGYWYSWEVTGYTGGLSERQVYPFIDLGIATGFHSEGSNFVFVDGHADWYPTYPDGWQYQPPDSFYPAGEY